MDSKAKATAKNKSEKNNIMRLEKKIHRPCKKKRLTLSSVLLDEEPVFSNSEEEQENNKTIFDDQNESIAPANISNTFDAQVQPKLFNYNNLISHCAENKQDSKEEREFNKTMFDDQTESLVLAKISNTCGAQVQPKLLNHHSLINQCAEDKAGNNAMTLKENKDKHCKKPRLTLSAMVLDEEPVFSDSEEEREFNKTIFDDQNEFQVPLNIRNTWEKQARSELPNKDNSISLSAENHLGNNAMTLKENKDKHCKKPRLTLSAMILDEEPVFSDSEEEREFNKTIFDDQNEFLVPSNISNTYDEQVHPELLNDHTIISQSAENGPGNKKTPKKNINQSSKNQRLTLSAIVLDEEPVHNSEEGEFNNRTMINNKDEFQVPLNIRNIWEKQARSELPNKDNLISLSAENHLDNTGKFEVSESFKNIEDTTRNILGEYLSSRIGNIFELSILNSNNKACGNLTRNFQMKCFLDTHIERRSSTRMKKPPKQKIDCIILSKGAEKVIKKEREASKANNVSNIDDNKTVNRKVVLPKKPKLRRLFSLSNLNVFYTFD